MTEQKQPQGLLEIIRQGYQPHAEQVEGGYQPRAQGPVDLKNLKPPKGGSAVVPPQTARPTDSKQ